MRKPQLTPGGVKKRLTQCELNSVLRQLEYRVGCKEDASERQRRRKRSRHELLEVEKIIKPRNLEGTMETEPISLGTIRPRPANGVTALKAISSHRCSMQGGVRQVVLHGQDAQDPGQSQTELVIPLGQRSRLDQRRSPRNPTDCDLQRRPEAISMRAKPSTDKSPQYL